MLGCQLVFHCPDSSASRASSVYVHRSGTPGNVHVTDNLAVAEDPSRETDATVTPGFNGPMPGDERLKQIIDCCAGGAHERQRRKILALRPAASAAAAWSAVLPSGPGFGLGGNIPHPATARTRVSSTYPRRAGAETVGWPHSRHRAILPPCTSVGSVAAMGIYAKRPARMIGQLFGDGFVLLWTVGWAIVGIFVHRVIEVLATPARETARTATRLAENFARPRPKPPRCQSPVSSYGVPRRCCGDPRQLDHLCQRPGRQH